MDALINFRDFGGYHTKSGSVVARDRLFRSGHFANLDDAGRSAIEDMAFALIVDLRYADERTHQPSPWSETRHARVIHHRGSIVAEAPHIHAFASSIAEGGSISDGYRRVYAELPYDDVYRPFFAQALGAIANTSERVLIHCTAGKDRTGALAALLLDVLGVPRDLVVADYMLSRNAAGLQHVREDVRNRMPGAGTSAESAKLDESQLDAMVGVDPSYIEAVFNAIAERDGSVENYLQRSGVTAADFAALRRNLLAP